MRSVYIHIPFCNSICSYCDFCKYLNNELWASNYLDSLEKEINKYYEEDIIRTLYIGGGTPSSLSKHNLKKLFNILKVFKITEDCEFTFECNVNDINDELLKILKENNVNRISIGVESFNKYNLKFLNRKHDKKSIIKNIKLCKEYGFDNINVDLIYALPTENMSILKSDIKSLLKLDVDHISTYSLIIEKHTALYNKKVKSVSEELDYKMYKYICKKLKRKGFYHYEVSNFAKVEKESKHNLTYWNNQEYYGFGLGSHGYINDMRYENTRSYNKYIRGEYRLDEFLVSIREEMENEVILGLRKLDGISIENFKNKFNTDIFSEFKFDEAILKKLIINKNGYLYIPEDKIYIMNEIINMIL
ncbi:MAG: radical SAM family heme chaperone HemW [bacterium]|nr:radical SAM family heme chaperone HemW [bacterium]